MVPVRPYPYFVTMVFDSKCVLHKITLCDVICDMIWYDMIWYDIGNQPFDSGLQRSCQHLSLSLPPSRTCWSVPPLVCHNLPLANEWWTNECTIESKQGIGRGGMDYCVPTMGRCREEREVEPSAISGFPSILRDSSVSVTMRPTPLFVRNLKWPGKEGKAMPANLRSIIHPKFLGSVDFQSKAIQPVFE